MASSTEVDLNGGESIYHVLNELHVVQKCCAHENILGCKSTVQNQKILVSFESAKSLNSFLFFQRGCKIEYVSYVIRGTLEALRCIHQRGTRLHGNINLNTVFLDKDCVVKLGFPARITNPDLESDAKYFIELYMTKSDLRMVGELSYVLYHGESLAKELGRFDSMMLLPEALQDFVKLCVDSSFTPTIRELLEHAFFNKINGFEKYYEHQLKKVLEKELPEK